MRPRGGHDCSYVGISFLQLTSTTSFAQHSLKRSSFQRSLCNVQQFTVGSYKLLILVTGIALSRIIEPISLCNLNDKASCCFWVRTVRLANIASVFLL